MLKDLRRKKKKVFVEPEEVFQSCGITMARYGRFMMMRNDMTPSEYKEFRAKMAKDFPRYCKEIDTIVSNIREQVRNFDPLILLQCGYFNCVRLLAEKKSESEYGLEEAYSLRMLDYVQSVIVSTPGPYDTSEACDQEAWDKLCEAVKALYVKLTPWFQIMRSAFLEANEEEYDAEYDSLYAQAEMLWLNVRGDRYSVHDIPHLHDLLAPHDEVFKELFGVSSGNFVDGMASMQSALTFGLGHALEEMREFQNEVLGGREFGDTEDLDEKMRELVKGAARKKEWRDRWESVAGRFFGLDLFDVEKVTKLPVPLIELLAWEVGEEKEFFASGDYSGWPLRLLPVSVRPFLRVESKFYCFDLSNLMDNVYRMMQRLVTRLKPEYIETWNIRQKAVSEDVPFVLLERILPGATIYKNVYYLAPTGPGDKWDWCELDGLLIYDDHVIVTEVKAGAFTYTPPTSDFDAYITSVKDLILKPAKQVSRFMQCLNIKGEVDFCDRQHKKIGTIRRNEFREIIPCCITLDNLTELAARADKLGGIGVIVPEGVWCTSVNDLRVYADLFNLPIFFTHFLEQRRKATAEKTIELIDELDHLGLYLEHNFYVQYVKNLAKELEVNHVNWHGYRKKIDEYYYMLIVEPKKAVKPGQKQVKGYFAKTLDLIASSEKPKRCKAASYILDMSGQARGAFNSMITEVLAKQEERRKIIPVSLFGGRTLTVFCLSRGIELPARNWMQEHALKRMLIAEEKLWLSLILTFNTGHELSGVDFEHLCEKDIPVDRRVWLEREAKAMRGLEVEKAVVERGRIGRNELCPCGSGKKYKRCCGRQG